MFAILAITLIVICLNIDQLNISPREGVVADSWYDYDWSYRKAITVQHEQVDDDLTGFPVLVSLESDTELASSAQDDGDDILFTDSGGNKLSHEIELFDGATGQLVAWVKTDLLNESDTNLYIYFGNADCENQQNATGVWSSGYVSVFHLNQQNDGSANTDDLYLDSSATGNHADDRVALTEKEGKIGLGQSLNGVQDHIIVDEHMIGGANQAFVVSAWVKSDQTIVYPDGRAIIHNYYNAVQNGNWELSSNNSDAGIRASARNSDRSATYTGTRTHPSFDGQWHNHKFIIDPTLNKVRRYTDGVLKTNENFNALGLPVRDANSRARVMHALGGSIDELYFYDGILSGEWITTEYNNQSSPDTFIELSTLEIGDTTPPENPTTFSAYDSSGQSVELSEGWNKYNQPYFSWNDAEEPDSAVDGYYIYFGTDDTADPELTSGIINANSAVQYQAGTNLNISPTISDRMTAGETYYFILKSKNTTGNDYSVSDSELYFTYSYDPTAPNPPEYINISPAGCTIQTTFDFTWPDATDSGGSDISHYESKRGSTGTIQSIGDVNSFKASSYQEGDNILYIRSVDNAGNTSSWQTAVYCSTGTSQIVDGPSVDAGPSSITVEWVSSKNTTGYVKVYEGNTYVSEQGHTSYSNTHSVKVVGLESEKPYRYKLVWTDENGNLGESDWFETNTATTPQVTNLKAEPLSPTNVLVSWQTNYLSNNSIEYGAGGYNTTENIDGYATSFSKQLTNLEAGSAYQLRVKAYTDDSSLFSGGITFNTPPLPSISNLSFETKNTNASPSLELSWKTNVDTTSTVFYRIKDTGSYQEKSNTEKKSSHSMTVENLADSTIYEVYVSGIDQFGNEAKSSVNTINTPLDTRPPTISDIVIESSNVGVGKEDEAQAIISWKTDEPATSYVEYGEGINGESYTNKTVEDQTSSTSHLVIVSGFKDKTPYHLRVCSKDKGNNLTCSPDQMLIPGEVPKSLLNVILNALKNTFGWLEGLL